MPSKCLYSFVLTTLVCGRGRLKSFTMDRLPPNIPLLGPNVVVIPSKLTSSTLMHPFLCSALAASTNGTSITAPSSVRRYVECDTANTVPPLSTAIFANECRASAARSRTSLPLSPSPSIRLSIVPMAQLPYVAYIPALTASTLIPSYPVPKSTSPKLSRVSNLIPVRLSSLPVGTAILFIRYASISAAGSGGGSFLLLLVD
mmetsp:Transcript_6358/g.12285  ORF Transcript_6358/g.12285 Transcript_6358/m.12285 type:complete len:202 (+) Transcript_6358:201-806(+)